MKQNSCEVEFYCYTNEDCVYSTYPNNNRRCKYFDVNQYGDEVCKSKVAQANAMTLKLKEMGL